MEDNKYYVYLHIKETTGEPFYVGKGYGIRANRSGKYRSKHWNRIVNKYGFDIIFLEINLTEQEALEKEIYWIKRIGRKDLNEGPLVNFTNGGEGSSGYKHTDETRNKMSEIGKKKKLSEEHKQRIGDFSRGKIGYKKTEQTKNKIRDYVIGSRRMNNMIENRLIIKDEIELYLSLGYVFGWKNNI